MSVWRKVLGLPLAPKVPEPRLGQLHRLDDRNVVYRHNISSGLYNVYEADGCMWLTIRIEAAESHSQSNGPNTEASIELNLPIKDKSVNLIYKGSIIKFPSYSQELGNLTSMFYFTHSAFENAIVVFEEISANSIVARISGAMDYDPVVVRCQLALSSSLQRSFN